MRASPRIVIAILAVLLSSIASAQTLNGTLKNGTTGKPSAGDDVILIKLGQGMEEAARTKSDASGHFTFNLPDNGPHLIRAVHDGVTYHSMAPPGTNSVEVQVFDVAKKLKDISVTADVMRFEAQGNQLQATRLFAVNNTSNPPRTQMNDQNFEFYLPEGAQIVDSSAETAGGQPLKTDPVPQKEKNRYAFNFPLRPGQTLFQIGFELPYNGELSIDPKSLYPAQHFVVMLPKTMKFSAGPGSGFEARANPREPSTTVQVASNTEAGQALNFKISGTGTLGEAREDGEGSASGPDNGPAAAGRDARPGGGLGPPIDAPDPLEKYRWYILGSFAVILAAGAVYITSRSRSAEFRAGERSLATMTDLGASDTEVAGRLHSRQPASGRAGLLLEALKEELFELEVEHKQGSISQQEYDRARAALDQTLERAIKRGASPPKNASARD
ncbi:MAG TPA: carboxypeptidase-like regulatory domain-containing protein [Terriglobales bacterium]|nr:carboxypeptidase-like regulatory domain-containing protein [Terriglobales bacterium]